MNEALDREKARLADEPETRAELRRNSKAFNGRHRKARVEQFNGAQRQKAAVAKSRRKMAKASKRKNRD
jgi:hypothetical protein